MANPFKKTNIGDGNELLQHIGQSLEQIEKQLQSLSDKSTEYHVHIEELNVNHPVLENLTFRLDQLDIKELSGALNLGNNFAAQTDKKPKKEKPENLSQQGKTDAKAQDKNKGRAESKAEVNKHTPGNIDKTTTGFRMKL
jgi:ABC-type transporter Mla subunit MlaD